MTIGRHLGGIAAIGAAWGLGQAVEALVGFPAPIAGLVILAAAALLWPGALERIGATADLAVRWLPLLFVPWAIGGASVLGEVDAAALVAAVAVSVPIGFVVAARLAR